MRVAASLNSLLECGLDDWVHAALVASVAKSVGGAETEAEIEALSLTLIRNVVEAGYMQLGDVVRDVGFRAWSMPSAQAIDQATRQWQALDHLPDMTELYWLANTPAGDAHARAQSNAT